jgi:peptide chain release factor subunit 1
MTSFKLSVFKEYLKIREYSKLKGKGTELITLIVPSSKTPEYVLNKLKQQKQETANVKSKQTRKAILEALDRIIFYLKKTPPTQSCIILSGLIDNKMYFEVFFFPGVNSFNYHCSDHFRLDKIIEYVGFNNYYLATMTLNESTVCLMEDNQLKTLKKFVSYVPSKTKKGGQSARRYAQIRENEKREFFFRVSSFINQLPKKEYPLLLGGSVPTVDSFISDKYLSVDVKKKIVGPY